MNKIVTIALASMFAVSPVAGVAYAQDAKAPMTADGMATGAVTADNVNVVQISTLEADKSQSGEADRLKMKANDPSEMEKVQAELKSDSGLAEVLAAQSVQLENVIEIQTSATGGKVVYVK